MAISLIQTTKGGALSGTSYNLTAWGSNTTTGNAIIVSVFASAAGTPSITDSQSNSYTMEKQTSGTGQVLSVFRAKNITGGTTPTITITQPSGQGNAIAREYSGLDTTEPFDLSAGASGSAGSASSGATGTTNQASELIIGSGTDAANLFTVGTTYGNLTNQELAGSGVAVFMEDKIVSSTGAQTATFNNATSNWVVIVTTFKAATANATVNDTQATSENVPTPLLSYTPNQSDTVGTTESVGYYAESIQTTENVIISIVSNPTFSVSDTVTTTENVPTPIVSYTINVSDTATTSENINQTLVDNVSVNDTEGTSENVPTPQITYIPNVSDTEGTSENISVLIPVLLATVSDSESLTENVPTPKISYSINVSDAVTTTESIVDISIEFEGVSDTVNTAESIVMNAIAMPNVHDNLGTSENVNLLIPTILITVSDSTTTSENIGLLALEFINVSDTVNTSENLDIIRANSRDVKVSDSTTASESVVVSELSGTLAINVNDADSLTENVSVLIPIVNISVSDSTTLSESIIVTSIDLINTSDSIVTSENVALQIITSVNVNDTTSITENISLSFLAVINVSDSVSILEGWNAKLETPPPYHSWPHPHNRIGPRNYNFGHRPVKSPKVNNFGRKFLT